MDCVCSQYGGARMQESYRPTGAKSAQMAGAALRGFRAIMFADDCRYGCREATTTGQKREIESTLITNAGGPLRERLRLVVLRCSYSETEGKSFAVLKANVPMTGARGLSGQFVSP
jgi:hypothetical protein